MAIEARKRRAIEAALVVRRVAEQDSRDLAARAGQARQEAQDLSSALERLAESAVPAMIASAWHRRVIDLHESIAKWEIAQRARRSEAHAMRLIAERLGVEVSQLQRTADERQRLADLLERVGWSGRSPR